MSGTALSHKVQKSLRSKFVRLLLFVTGLIGISTLVSVIVMSAQASSRQLAAVQGHIEEGIISKGRVLTVNHALGLRGYTLDNAFLDMQRLVERAVREDQDLVYGIYVNSERRTLAIARRDDASDKSELPAQDAWKALGLSEAGLLVNALRVERATRLGHELLEVAAPVVSEEGEALGTVRYGLSTQRMHEALAQAERDSQDRLQSSVLFITGLVSVAMLLGLLLSRAQAVHITEPVSALTRAAESLATGDRSVRVQIKSGDELELLGSSFNRMVEELGASYGALEQMNRTLEQKVEARTAELALKNRDMRLVLDNVDQGFITVTPDGTISGERSRVVDKWFGEAQPGGPFWKYIEAFSRSFAVAFRLAWSQLEDGFLPLEVCLHQLPEQLTKGPRTWSFRYLPFYREDGELEGVLVVIADITERLAREREEAEQTELMQGFKKLMLDRSGFTNFLREAGGMVQQITDGANLSDQTAVKRTLHTLKGSAGVMGLTVVARLCHTLETQLAEEARMSERTLLDLGTRWTAICEHVTKFIGASGPRTIEIAESEYAALVSRLSRNDRQSDLLHEVLTWQLEPVARPLQLLADQAKALGRRLGKGDIDVEVQASNVRLDPQIWTPFFSELTHVVRNAVDHGLEPAAERKTLRKSAAGTILLKAEINGDTLSFEITDDGRGINWSAISERAKNMGLAHANHADLVAALCTDGITTHTRVTDVSGRGVGMAAFRQCVEALSGRLDVRSASGVGTTWFIRFPWPMKNANENSNHTALQVARG